MCGVFLADTNRPHSSSLVHTHPHRHNLIKNWTKHKKSLLLYMVTIVWNSGENNRRNADAGVKCWKCLWVKCVDWQNECLSERKECLMANIDRSHHEIQEGVQETRIGCLSVGVWVRTPSLILSVWLKEERKREWIATENMLQSCLSPYVTTGAYYSWWDIL